MRSSSTKSTIVNSARGTWLVRAYFALTLLTISSVFVLRRQAQASNVAALPLESSHAELCSDTLFYHRLKQSANLRGLWRHWAVSHWNTIATLQTAHPGSAAYQRAYRTLPVNVPAFFPLTSSAHNQPPIAFMWRPCDISRTSDTDQSGTKGDVEIARSVNAGTERISLWASGRITREQYFVTSTVRGLVWWHESPHVLIPSFADAHDNLH